MDDLRVVRRRKYDYESAVKFHYRHEGVIDLDEFFVRIIRWDLVSAWVVAGVYTFPSNDSQNEFYSAQTNMF